MKPRNHLVRSTVHALGWRALGVAGVCILVAGCPAGPSIPPTFMPSGPRVPNHREEISSSMVRVSTFRMPRVALGACATYEAEPTTRSCLPADKSVAVDLALRPDLNNSGFRYYTRLVDLNVSGNASAPGGSGSVGVARSRYELIMEWGRWRTQQMGASTDAAAPIVSAVDVGTAVRVIFDVELSRVDIELEGSAAFARLATALALNAATVTVRYDTVGTTVNLLPRTSLTTVRDVETYVSAVNSFYDAVFELARAYEGYARQEPGAAPDPEIRVPQPRGEPTALSRRLVDVPAMPSDQSAFAPGVIAYYVSNLPSVASADNTAFAGGYLHGVRQLAAGASCKKAVAGSSSRSAAFRGGVQRAYSDYLATTTCDDREPSKDLQRKAADAVAF